jgi:hypothetical protein|tara:strand:+ start:1123 stop:1323 length:201 start_codon:yes stop_codon:yes gene_type:complete
MLHGSVTGANVTVASLTVKLRSHVPFVAEMGVLGKLVKPNPRNFCSGIGELEYFFKIGSGLFLEHE